MLCHLAIIAAASLANFPQLAYFDPYHMPMADTDYPAKLGHAFRTTLPENALGRGSSEIDLFAPTPILRRQLDGCCADMRKRLNERLTGLPPDRVQKMSQGKSVAMPMDMMEWPGEDVAWLKRAILDHVLEIESLLRHGHRSPPNNHLMVDVKAWANFFPHGAFNSVHGHGDKEEEGGWDWVGVYYVDTGDALCAGPDPRQRRWQERPEHCHLKLEDPRPVPQHRKEIREGQGGLLANVANGTLLVFPSWLRHSTVPFPEPEPRVRISIAFNVKILKRLRSPLGFATIEWVSQKPQHSSRFQPPPKRLPAHYYKGFQPKSNAHVRRIRRAAAVRYLSSDDDDDDDENKIGSKGKIESQDKNESKSKSEIKSKRKSNDEDDTGLMNEWGDNCDTWIKNEPDLCKKKPYQKNCALACSGKTGGDATVADEL